MAERLRGETEDMMVEPLPEHWVEITHRLDEQEKARERVQQARSQGQRGTSMRGLVGSKEVGPQARERSIAMVSLKDCMALCGPTEHEVMAIAAHAHVPEIAAAAMGRYLLKKPDGPELIRDMIRDDIHAALNCCDKDHASELLMVLR